MLVRLMSVNIGAFGEAVSMTGSAQGMLIFQILPTRGQIHCLEFGPGLSKLLPFRRESILPTFEYRRDFCIGRLL